MSAGEGGIYALIDTKGRWYIGSTKSFKNRSRSHLKDIANGVHRNGRILRAAAAGEVFRFCPLEIVFDTTKAKLEEREQTWIDDRNPHYNIVRKVGLPDWKSREAMSACERDAVAALVKSVRWGSHLEAMLKAAGPDPEWRRTIRESIVRWKHLEEICIEDLKIINPTRAYRVDECA